MIIQLPQQIFTMYKFLLLVCAFCAFCLLCACNVSRAVTTQAQRFVSGDTVTTITTKTVETYTAEKKY